MFRDGWPLQADASNGWNFAARAAMGDARSAQTSQRVSAARLAGTSGVLGRPAVL